MNRLRNRSLLLALLLALTLLCGCNTGSSGTDWFAMDTVLHFEIYNDGRHEAADACIEQIRTLERLLSATDPDAALYRLNAGGEVAPELCAVLRRTLELSAQTGGALDPTVYPLVRLWGFPTDDYRVPAQAEIDAALRAVGPSHVHLDADGVRLDAGTELDFGAVAKGLAGDRCAEILQRRGLCGILSLGGNVQTVGTKPDGSDWSVGIQDPEDPSGTAAVLSVTGTKAVVTSGSYQRYFEQDGTRYHHILDPRTGRPAESGLLSVTVVCDDGFTADGLSTALFVMGLEDATAYWRAHGGFEAVLIDTDGKLYVTAGLADRLQGPAEVLPAEAPAEGLQ